MPQALRAPTHGFGLRSSAPHFESRQTETKAVESDAGGLSFKLLLVFIALLFSNAAQMFPVLEVVRPDGAIVIPAASYVVWSSQDNPRPIPSRSTSGVWVCAATINGTKAWTPAVS